MGKKHTSQQALEELPLPTPATPVARVTDNRGGGNYDVQLPAPQAGGELTTLIVSLPAKFRKLIWVKKGSYVIIQLADESAPGSKVAGEITNVLFPDQIKHIKSQGLWPADFAAPAAKNDDNDEDAEGEECEEVTDSDNDDDLFVNSNRRVQSSDDEDEDE
ncbi:hypothetical protein PhCBS80983_g05246 [Powellomyces hirtus]|uniref:S1-like domain-containing protein n=1 Tax=Powellomyces hirtus TaxID=109895 RepID=A0A507DX54_9FUNG|nr:hypothetical protein PhCBS80983_g05246 [Powellomyces hirtus]